MLQLSEQASQRRLKTQLSAEMLSSLRDMDTNEDYNRIPDPPWFKNGLCHRTGLELFFPDDKEDARHKTPKAKAICATPCPVKDKCLQYALETNSQYGVWGGTTRTDRKRIQAEMKLMEMTPKEWIECQKLQ